MNFKNGLDQQFHHPFATTLDMNTIFKLFEEKKLKDIDIKICDIFSRFDFLTAEQVESILKIMHPESGFEKESKKRLKKLLELRVLNSFTLENFDGSSSSYIYCMDIGGGFIANNYSNIFVDGKGVMGRAMKDSGKISKKLIAAETFIQYSSLVGDRLVKFDSDPRGTQVAGNHHPFDFSMIIDSSRANGDKRKLPVIGEFVKEEDVLDNLTKRLCDISYLYGTATWKKTYKEVTMGIPGVPDSVRDAESSPLLLLLIAENEDMMMDISRSLFSGRDNKNALDFVRLMTYDMLLSEEFKGMCYKYHNKTPIYEESNLKLVTPAFATR